MGSGWECGEWDFQSESTNYSFFLLERNLSLYLIFSTLDIGACSYGKVLNWIAITIIFMVNFFEVD